MFGTIGVEEINSLEQFSTYLNKNQNYSSFLAEEFIQGKLYHCDFIIQNGQYDFIEVSEYLHNGLSFINGFNHGSILLTQDHPLRSSITEFCKRINIVFGLKSGCAHFEIFVNEKQELIFLGSRCAPCWLRRSNYVYKYI